MNQEQREDVFRKRLTLYAKNVSVKVEIVMNISRHAMERYAERLMDKDNKTDVSLFISNHIQKINDDIEKMIEYGEMLYEGRSLKKDWQNAVVQIYLRDNWIVIVDKNKQNVITIFSLDLGVGDEMNQQYISLLREKLSKAKAAYAEKCQEIDAQKDIFHKLIEENEDIIKEYRRIVNSLVEQNESYESLIKELETNKDLAELEVREIIGIFTGKNVF